MRANARRILLEIENLHIALISHTGKDPEKGERRLKCRTGGR
jgi:hypothetical protein